MLSTIIVYRPTELGVGPQRSETRHSCTGISATCCETSWPGQWLRYLAAVVSICEYTVSNKGGLPCHCHDCGQLWGLCPHALYLVGATSGKSLLQWYEADDDKDMDSERRKKRNH